MDKKGMNMGTKLMMGVLGAIIGIILIFTTLAETASDVSDAATNITTLGASTYPLVNFFKPKGIVLLAFIAAVIAAIFAGLFSMMRGK